MKVVLAAARVCYYIAPSSHLQKTIPPLLRLLHLSHEIERVVLSYILLISHNTPVSLYSDRNGDVYAC